MKVFLIILCIIGFVIFPDGTAPGVYNFVPIEEKVNTLPDDYFITKEYSTLQFRYWAEKWSSVFNLNKAIVKNLIEAESGWDHSAISNTGAIGLMQLLPSTAKDLGLKEEVSLYNPALNIYLGCKYLKRLLDTYKGNYKKAITAYNVGPGALQQGKKSEFSYYKKIFNKKSI